MTDQAEGLRRIFVGEMRRMVAFVGPGGSPQAFPARLAVNLAALGHKVLLLDESLSSGERNRHLDQACARDLDDVLAGSVAIETAVRALTPQLHLLAGGGADMARPRPRPEARIALMKAFYRLAGRYDVVVVDALGQDLHNPPSFAWACQDVVVACDEPRDAMTAAYACIKTMRQPERRFHVLFSAMEQPRMAQLYRTLAAVCRHHLHMMPECLGCVPARETGHAALRELTEKVLCWPLPPDRGGHFPLLMRRLLRAAMPPAQFAAR